MEINDELVSLITRQVMAALQNSEETQPTEKYAELEHGGRLVITEKGDAPSGQCSGEIVVGLAPAFGTAQTCTVNGLSHYDVLREIAAGIEEEGLRVRFVKVYVASDASFIAFTAAKLSGSGIGMGIQSAGTAVIHQKGLNPPKSLEMFPRAALLTLDIYRAIGKNAARCANGRPPVSTAVRNDCMARPKYQAKATILHMKETELCDASRAPAALEIRFERGDAAGG